MDAIRLTLTASVLVAAGTISARAQDLGRLLEQAARQAVKDQFAPAGDRPDPARAAVAKPAHQPLEGSEPIPIRTADGWVLVVHRFAPSAAARPGDPPIVLCHGLGYNATFWDLHPSCSLARFLAARGHDVWVVSLRGCGLSRKWVARLAPEVIFGDTIRRLTKGKIAPTGYASLDPKYADWSMDDHIAYDVPAVVNFVRRATRSADVTWIGHSMGGIVALGSLARHANPGIGRLVVVGSQVTMPEGQVLGQFLRESLSDRELLLAAQVNPGETVELVQTSVDRLFFNERNVLPPVYQALTTRVWAKDSPSLGLVKQYLLLAERRQLMDASGRFNYARAMPKVQVPILIMGGETDQFAPIPVQRDLKRLVGSVDKSLILLGKAAGFSADYGHNDAVVGLNAQSEVYPLIERWLSGERFTPVASGSNSPPTRRSP